MLFRANGRLKFAKLNLQIKNLLQIFHYFSIHFPKKLSQIARVMRLAQPPHVNCLANAKVLQQVRAFNLKLLSELYSLKQ